MHSQAPKTCVSLFLLLLTTSFLFSCGSKKTTSTIVTSPKILSATQSPSPYPTQTFTPISISETINYQATADALTNGRVCEGAIIMGVSPNKEWVIINCDPNPSTVKTTTKVLRLDKTVSWEISFYEIYGMHVGIGNGYISAVHWSKDGNYVYLHPSFCCVDAPEDVFFNFFGNNIGVYRLDLKIGKLTTTLQPTFDSHVSSYAVSFSSKDKYLTYTHSTTPTKIHIQNIQTGELRILSLDSEYEVSGLFSWSPDDKKLVIVATKTGWQPYDDTQPDNSVSYFLFDTRTEKVQVLFDKSDLYNVTWLSDDELQLSRLLQDEVLIYDLQARTFSQATPNP